MRHYIAFTNKNPSGLIDEGIEGQKKDPEARQNVVSPNGYYLPHTFESASFAPRGIVTVGELQVTFSEKFDVVVVGGGPIGGIAAKGLAEKGLNTMILEEHTTIGQPEHCAGLISINGLGRLGITPSRRAVLNKVKGATLFSRFGAQMTVERQYDQAYVLDRASLDRQIADEAAKKGSGIALNAKATSVDIKPEEAVVATEMPSGRSSKEKMRIRADLVISCEGALANLSRQVGLGAPNPRMRLYATQFEMNGVRLERDDLVQIHLGRTFAPGFFAWVIPTGSNSARVGLASKVPKSLSLLRYFVSHHPPTCEMFAKAKVEKTFGGLVLTGGPTRRTYSNRFLAIGDCAGQTKPTTGGGVVMGGTCAKIATRVVLDCSAHTDYSKRFLERYEKEWRRELSREFSTMLWARRLMNYLPDGLLDKLVRTAVKSGLADLMEQKGDIDLQSNFLKTILRNPRIIIAPILSLLGIR
ncbi:MAG: NAD(P)/FAD-dependent oxidoreductase [Promethearchaeati archaeon SRVP18_Atabeyarchaeia-1]